MTFQATEGACAFAWRNYLLVHSGIREDDHRRSALHRYLADLGHAGDFNFDLLQIAAVSYLKSLDELHDDRGARLAADQVLAKRVHSRASDNAAAGPRGSGLQTNLSNRQARRERPSRAFRQA
jgi:hypothetical protein